MKRLWRDEGHLGVNRGQMWLLPLTSTELIGGGGEFAEKGQEPDEPRGARLQPLSVVTNNATIQMVANQNVCVGQSLNPLK